MPNPALIPTFLREVFASRTLERVPEPDLVMDDPEQVEAYSAAGRIDGIMSAGYLFHSARASLAIQGCRDVLDLGCGPATQLAQLAELNPQTRFLGVDLSERMLEEARAHVGKLGLGNVRFACGDICALKSVQDESFDGVISTMTLHHLPTLQHLVDCFGEVRRVLRPGGAVYLVDFGRLKSAKSVDFFVGMDAQAQPPLFRQDYERSLRAAFTRDDFESATHAQLNGVATLVSTFQVPFLVMVKTADRPLPAPTRQRLLHMRAALAPRYRRDLDDLRTFFKLGGLRNDPFG